MNSQNPETNPAVGVSFSVLPVAGNMDGTHSQPAARHGKETLLNRLLNHHEIATLLLLLSSPIDAGAKPEIPSLQEAGLVEQFFSQHHGMHKIRLTSEGNALLKGLGLTGHDGWRLSWGHTFSGHAFP